MKRWRPVITGLLVLAGALLRADYASTPLDATLLQQSPYRFVGMIMRLLR